MIDTDKFDETLKQNEAIIKETIQKEFNKCKENPVYFFRQYVKASNLEIPPIHKCMIEKILKGYKIRLFGGRRK